MADTVPGVVVPPGVLARIDAAGADKEAQQETGIATALKLLEKLQQTPGIHGVHIMAVHWEEVVPRLIDDAGLPRPVLAGERVMA